MDFKISDLPLFGWFKTIIMSSRIRPKFLLLDDDNDGKLDSMKSRR